MIQSLVYNPFNFARKSLLLYFQINALHNSLEILLWSSHMRHLLRRNVRRDVEFGVRTRVPHALVTNHLLSFHTERAKWHLFLVHKTRSIMQNFEIRNTCPYCRVRTCPKQLREVKIRFNSNSSSLLLRDWTSPDSLCMCICACCV